MKTLKPSSGRPKWKKEKDIPSHSIEEWAIELLPTEYFGYPKFLIIIKITFLPAENSWPTDCCTLGASFVNYMFLSDQHCHLLLQTGYSPKCIFCLNRDGFVFSQSSSSWFFWDILTHRTHEALARAQDLSQWIAWVH